MSLRSLRVEQFHGVSRAEVTFEPTTLLIGENGCGVSSVLEALAMALSTAGGPRARIEPRHLVAPGEPARAALTFRESSPGSWDRPGLEALIAVLPQQSGRPRTLILEIEGGPAPGGVETHWTIRSAGGGTARDDLAALAAVRRINPLVWLRHGELLRPALEGDPGSDPATLVRPLEAGLQPAAEMDAGAAHRQLDEWAPGLRRPSRGMRAAVSEILALGDSRTPAVSVPPVRGTGGSPAQRLGILAVAARVVEELKRSETRGVRPIIVVEEPEAHLHPMTLASVWGLLDVLDAQKIVTTQSGTLLAAAPLRSIRRLVRGSDGSVGERHIGRATMRRDELRKIAYHLRARRSVACFARTWLLVEGETEFWVLPDLARLCGYDLAQEGVVCVEFAQCGLPPLIKLADRLGISWHVLTDGDRAGHVYVRAMQASLRGRSAASRLTQIPDRDIEHCFWRHGFAGVFQRLANVPPGAALPVRRVIAKAIDRYSKPDVAFELLSAVAERGAAGVPPPFRAAIEACVALARGEPDGDLRGTPAPRPRRAAQRRSQRESFGRNGA